MNRNAAGRPSRYVCGLFCLVYFLASVADLASAQEQSVQTATTISDLPRQHPRIAQTEVPGRRVELKSLKGAKLFTGPNVDTSKPVPLIVHFHGVSWLIEYHIAVNVPDAALITVNLGAGSSVYGRPFERSEAFKDLIDEAGRALKLKRGWSSITLTGFSAGYGAVRAILRHGSNYALVQNVLLLDGMHASYLPEGLRLADGGKVNDADLDSFVRFAREAAAGRKTFILTHSQIFPGTYVSTTEACEYLISAIDIKRRREPKPGPIGMRQLSEAKQGGLHIFGYSGNTAADHVDHLQAMPEWLKLFRIK